MWCDIEHIIWDWNGTLLDDVSACVTAINRMLVVRGKQTVDVNHYRRIFDFPVKGYYLALGFDLDREDWDAMAREFHDAYAEAVRECSLHHQIPAILAELQKMKIGLSVLSASEKRLLENMLSVYQIRDRFLHVYGLDDLYAHSKLEQGMDLMQMLQIDPSRVLLVGDTRHDAEVADALGCQVILLACGHQSRERLEATGAQVVDSHAGLLDLFH